jgi:hypothetical protein
MEYQPQTAAATLRLIVQGTDPWLAIGQFLDDWRRTDSERRLDLAAEGLVPDPDDRRWAALLAAAVEWLCVQDDISPPSWVSSPEWRLPEPWFLYPGLRLRAWQLVETPVAFRCRNIFGGDRILSRV